MSFTAGFYSFHVELSHPARSIYKTVRIKTARHPLESEVHLLARVLAWLHSWQEGLEFSEGLFQPKQPSIWKRDVIGQLSTIIEVGLNDSDKLKREIKHAERASISVYFYERLQLDRFCHGMRGSTTNWLEQVDFYQFDLQVLQELSSKLGSSMHWSLTISDDEFFLSWDDQYFEFKLTKLDIWQEYQDSLLQSAS